MGTGINDYADSSFVDELRAFYSKIEAELYTPARDTSHQIFEFVRSAVEYETKKKEISVEYLGNYLDCFENYYKEVKEKIAGIRKKIADEANVRRSSFYELLLKHNKYDDTDQINKFNSCETNLQTSLDRDMDESDKLIAWLYNLYVTAKCDFTDEDICQNINDFVIYYKFCKNLVNMEVINKNFKILLEKFSEILKVSYKNLIVAYANIKFNISFISLKQKILNDFVIESKQIQDEIDSIIGVLLNSDLPIAAENFQGIKSVITDILFIHDTLSEGSIRNLDTDKFQIVLNKIQNLKFSENIKNDFKGILDCTFKRYEKIYDQFAVHFDKLSSNLTDKRQGFFSELHKILNQYSNLDDVLEELNFFVNQNMHILIGIESCLEMVQSMNDLGEATYETHIAFFQELIKLFKTVQHNAQDNYENCEQAKSCSYLNDLSEKYNNILQQKLDQINQGISEISFGK